VKHIHLLIFGNTTSFEAIDGRGEDYVRALQDLWKPLNEDLIKKGTRKGWLWFSVMFPEEPRVRTIGSLWIA
jgi:hypothetical protein